eukprot:TRINITY_DN6293_c0_g1_i2.p1 TRINITY_DN6293_c0_g1~~TRINITY_DN6293_c0_g1_i2.p1  ORF type:complete len:498 (+),score=82.82 TRINITY_DN6293_c0_g1_i2:452-1945(+)
MTGLVIPPTWREESKDRRQSNWRASFSCVSGDKLIVGGAAIGRTVVNEIFLYKEEWEKAEGIKGKPPPVNARYCKAAGLSPTRLAVLVLESDMTLYVLNLSGMQWESFAILCTPRTGFALCSVGGLLFCHGGRETVTKSSPQPPFIQVNAVNGTVTECSQRGKNIPPDREMHASCSGLHDTLLIHGGVSRKGTILGDLWAYDTQSLYWMSIAGNIPLYRHTLVAASSYIVLYGGVSRDNKISPALWVWEVATNTWYECGPTAGTPPRPRMSHFMGVKHDAPLADTVFYLYGGEGARDVQYHSVHTLTIPCHDESALAARAEAERQEAMQRKFVDEMKYMEKRQAGIEMQKQQEAAKAAEVDRAAFHLSQQQAELDMEEQILRNRAAELDAAAYRERVLLHRVNREQEHLRGHKMRSWRGETTNVGWTLPEPSEPGMTATSDALPSFVRIPTHNVSDTDQIDICEAQRRATEQLLLFYDQATPSHTPLTPPTTPSCFN